MVRVLCEDCGWEGMMNELAPVHHDNPKEPGDVILEAVCPKCGSWYLENIDETPTKVPV